MKNLPRSRNLKPQRCLVLGPVSESIAKAYQFALLAQGVDAIRRPIGWQTWGVYTLDGVHAPASR